MNRREIIARLLEDEAKLLEDEAKESHLLQFSLFDYDPSHIDAPEFDDYETVILCVRSDAYGDVYVYENGDVYAYLNTGGHDWPIDDLRDTHQHLYLFIRKQLRR